MQKSLQKNLHQKLKKILKTNFYFIAFTKFGNITSFTNQNTSVQLEKKKPIIFIPLAAENFLKYKLLKHNYLQRSFADIEMDLIKK